MKISKAYIIFTFFILWSVFSILGLISNSVIVGRIVQLSVFALIGFALITVISRKDILVNRIVRFLIIWLLYASFVNLLYAFGTQLGLVKTMVAVFWWAIIFILFYSVFVFDVKNKYFNKLIKFYPYFFITVYALTVYQMVFNKGNIAFGIIDAEAINSVYWVLLLVPFSFLLKSKLLKYIILISTFVLILISSKRGASIAISLVFLMSVYYDSFQKKHFFRNLILGTLLIFSIISIQNWTLSKVDVNVMNRFEGMDFQEESRMYIYLDTWKNFNSKDIFQKLLGSGHRSTAIDRGILSQTAHNDYLEVLYDYGIIGLLLYLYFTLLIVKRLIKLSKTGGRYFHAYFSAFVLFLVMSMVSHLIIYPTYFAFIVVLWALTEAQSVKTHKTKYNYLQ